MTRNGFRLIALSLALLAPASGCTVWLNPVYVENDPEAAAVIMKASARDDLAIRNACAAEIRGEPLPYTVAVALSAGSGDLEVGMWLVDDLQTPGEVFAIDRTARAYTTWPHLDLRSKPQSELVDCALYED
ncbi:hypothetical protein [Litorihabitans aurantiacus]|uniref:Lipoprotein n=1 Tax=Litorihabitans aurantiacus TaxID=1930061 RepID=A0AA37XEH3_9MICO|nr:hypothetical protein [Litorihabitans aurantiacus]GMA31803.1 hypothetical protein GCM10025875_17950 [Litorihabitans aurantiacus]